MGDAENDDGRKESTQPFGPETPGLMTNIKNSGSFPEDCVNDSTRGRDRVIPAARACEVFPAGKPHPNLAPASIGRP